MVISIIALLIAILMPALNKAREAARTTVCLANCKGLSMAWMLYLSDNDDALIGPHDGYTDSPSKEYDWVNLPRDMSGVVVADSSAATVEEKKLGIQAGALYPYADNLDSFHCPSDRRDMTSVASGEPSHAWRSYSIASSMNGGFYGGRPVTKYHQIDSPSEKYVFIEEEADVGGNNWGGWGLQGPIDGNWDQWWDPIAIRHGEKNVMAFADGHAYTRIWVDERTLQMAEGQVFGLITPNNPDLEYMNRNYAQQK